CQQSRHLTRDPWTPGATLSGRGARPSRLIRGVAARQQAIGNQLVTKRGYRLVNAQLRIGTMAKNLDHPQSQTELPLIESPPVSPATPDLADEPAAVETPPALDAAPAADTSAAVNDKKEEEKI